MHRLYDIRSLVREAALRRGHTAETLKGGLLEGLAVVGVSNPDQLECTLTEVLPEEICDAVLCDDVVYVGPCGHHACTCGQENQISYEYSNMKIPGIALSTCQIANG